MRKILMSWIGATDLRAPGFREGEGLGPVAQALKDRCFDKAVLLSNYPAEKVSAYLSWLEGLEIDCEIEVSPKELSGPTAFAEIYQSVIAECERLRSKDRAAFTFHLSPGTPAMAAIWILVSKTRFSASLIESSLQAGVKDVEIPFDIAADFIPELIKERDQRLLDLASEPPPAAPAFEDIIHRSRVMSRLLERARRAAIRNVPVLIEGESGTGKEMLARALHRASTRSDGEFIAVNCGAIPAELVESELFGHEKGAFTGAAKLKKGYFEAAQDGTLFLDELGELPKDAQVKLLRALDQKEIVRVGGVRPVKVNARIIAATNRTLTAEIEDGNFREDLFYRLAVAILRLPPLRDRAGDLNLLLERLLEQVNDESVSEPEYERKKLSVGARKLMQAHSWPGNVRELLNTLRRAALWSPGSTISKEDVKDAILPVLPSAEASVLNRSIGDGLDLKALLAGVERHYLERAMLESGGNKSRAAKLLGLSNHQTLSNWLARHGLG